LEQEFAHEDTIGSHACSLEASKRVTNSIPLECPLPLSVRTFYDVTTLKDNGFTMHISDWYSTFCMLAGVSAADDPAVAPLPVNMDDQHKDIYGLGLFYRQKNCARGVPLGIQPFVVLEALPCMRSNAMPRGGVHSLAASLTL
jgi:hypothetical protein